MSSAPCPWPAAYAACPDIADCFEKFDDPAAAKDLYEQMASDALWLATGMIFGVCEATVHPCREGCEGFDHQSTFWGRGPGFDYTFPRLGGVGRGAGGWYPVLISGEWHNMSCGTCMGGCTCGLNACVAINLPGPVQTITSVTIDGTPLPETAYRVDNHRTLVRLDGECWPGCQDLLHPTFTVVYERGIPVPIAGQAAVARLACELALQACDDDRCALPSNLVGLTRQGVSATFADDWEKRADGWIGIPSIDNWVAQITTPRFASVRSVDSVRP